jgi:hypothetical protein
MFGMKPDFHRKGAKNAKKLSGWLRGLTAFFPRG